MGCRIKLPDLFAERVQLGAGFLLRNLRFQLGLLGRDILFKGMRDGSATLHDTLICPSAIIAETVISKSAGPARTFRRSDQLMANVDAWAASQSDKPGRSEAIRRLLDLGLKANGK